ncbi:SEC10/PgrA surface exclusion domain-containing protein, partial [Abiotrophia defectiva]
MKHTNTVYRYAIRKLKVGTASIAVAALMFLGSGNNLVNAADLNQESAFVANAGSSEIEQIEEKLPSQELPNSDLDVDTKALEADKSPVTNTEPVEINTPVPVEEAESIASELANLDLPEDVESQDSATQEATIKALAKDVSDAKENPAEEASSSDQKASLAEAESTVAKQAAVVNGANEAEEVKPLANANNTSDNKLVLPPGFTPDLFKEGAYTASQIDAIAKPGRALNTYKSNEADKNRIVDVNNLTEEQRKELSLYIANLINPIRQQFGKQPFKVNAGSLNAAQKVANAYQEDNWYAWTNSHDVNATTRALANVANGWGENLATISPNTTTMDSLKQQFHYQTVWMLFDDSHANFGHARNFLLFENPYGNHDVYLGVATNRAGANDSSKFGTQYYTMFAPKDGATEFTPGNDYSNDSQPTQPTEPTQPTQPTEPTQPTQPTEPTQPT